MMVGNLKTDYSLLLTINNISLSISDVLTYLFENLFTISEISLKVIFLIESSILRLKIKYPE